MSYTEISPRKKRFPVQNYTHTIISYVLHAISVSMIVFLLTKNDTPVTSRKLYTEEWYTFDSTTKTLHLNAQTLIIGDRKLRASIGNSKETPSVIIHGYLQSTGLDIEKEVIVHGTNNVMRGPPGPSGIIGQDGQPGIAGKDGIAGQNGQPGIAGKDGIAGQNGQPGIAGKDGIAGIDGKDGTPGINGEDGKDGIDGTPGITGEDGKDGKDGKDGTTGITGEDGKDGIDGKDGTPGITGEDGKDGKDGKDGLQGITGEDGQNGQPGIAGKDGLQGITGEDGKDGKDGEDGKDGKDGLQGITGASGESEWWNYDAKADILYIIPKMITAESIDITETAYVHGMLYAGNLDTADISGHPGHPTIGPI